jgi:hypothetical protein
VARDADAGRRRAAAARDTAADGEVVATAWGAGAEWVLDGVPQLLGAADDATGFEPRPEHPALVAALRPKPAGG